MTPITLTISSRAPRGPSLRAFAGNRTSFRVSFIDGAAGATNLTGLTPLFAWFRADDTTEHAKAAATVVGAPADGVVDFVFSAASVNYAPGTYVYEVGLYDGATPVTYQQGTWTILASAAGADADTVEWESRISVAVATHNDDVESHDDKMRHLTLQAALTAEITARGEAVSYAAATRAVYTGTVAGADLAYDAASWVAGIPGLSALSVDNSYKPTWNQNGYTAITDRVVAFANHDYGGTGTTVSFLGTDGAIVTRTIEADARIGTTDIRLGRLDTALPATVVPILLPSAEMYARSMAGVRGLWVSKDGLAGLMEFTAHTAAAAATDLGVAPGIGDSAKPVMVLTTEGTLVGIFQWTSTSSGPSYGANRADIQAQLVTWGLAAAGEYTASEQHFLGPVEERTRLGLGTAALQPIGAFATAAQGATADTAIQPGDNGNVAISVSAEDEDIVILSDAGESAANTTYLRTSEPWRWDAGALYVLAYWVAGLDNEWKVEAWDGSTVLYEGYSEAGGQTEETFPGWGDIEWTYPGSGHPSAAYGTASTTEMSPLHILAPDFETTAGAKLSEAIPYTGEDRAVDLAGAASVSVPAPTDPAHAARKQDADALLPETQTLAVDGAKSITVAKSLTVVNMAMSATATVTLNDPPVTTRPWTLELFPTQDGTGDRVLTIAGNTLGAGTFVLSTAATAKDYATLTWQGTAWVLTNARYAIT